MDGIARACSTEQDADLLVPVILSRSWAALVNYRREVGSSISMAIFIDRDIPNLRNL